MDRLGLVLGYRRGLKTQNCRYVYVKFYDVACFEDACKLIGRRVVCIFGDKKFYGGVIRPHGKKGVVIVRFNKPLPGQAIGCSVNII
ncbi:MAG: 50S ribosomal protein L35ae [archaeon GB-1845-036]|nr:50S ribosomal protein L35ae [Candidatus Culexmicrobium thermophilum]RLE55676.1 MAG: 50S ribosomal protein L35ae [Candidatus Verstraetearchaeota archaeon]HDO21202.1 50S ribosomal protein L35ae [Candidatus Bathyarchaeota archaeon]